MKITSSDSQQKPVRSTCAKCKRQRTWQGALKGKATIKGDLFSTDLDWEASR